MELWAETGVGLEEIIERLGHADDEITSMVYLHVTKTMKKEASQKFSELMRGLFFLKSKCGQNVVMWVYSWQETLYIKGLKPFNPNIPSKMGLWKIDFLHESIRLFPGLLQCFSFGGDP